MQDINSLQKISKRSCSDSHWLTRSVSIDNLYRECGWDTLEERRKQQKFISIFKSVNGLVPSYVSELIHSSVSEITDYPLRNQNNVSTDPFCRTETARKSSEPRHDKTNKVTLRPAKTQISLDIRQV